MIRYLRDNTEKKKTEKGELKFSTLVSFHLFGSCVLNGEDKQKIVSAKIVLEFLRIYQHPVIDKGTSLDLLRGNLF